MIYSILKSFCQIWVLICKCVWQNILWSIKHEKLREIYIVDGSWYIYDASYGEQHSPVQM